jgi:hypothetical protein
MECSEKNCGIKLRKYAYYVMYRIAYEGPFCSACAKFKSYIFHKDKAKEKIKRVKL